MLPPSPNPTAFLNFIIHSLAMSKEESDALIDRLEVIFQSVVQIGIQ